MSVTTTPPVPATVDFVFYQGSAFARTIRYQQADLQPVDMTGWSAHMEVRASAGGALLLLLTSVTPTPAGAGTIAINPSSGVLTLFVGGTITRSLPPWPASPGAVYDLLLIPPGGDDAQAIISGHIILVTSVTQS